MEGGRRCKKLVDELMVFKYNYKHNIQTMFSNTISQYITFPHTYFRGRVFQVLSIVVKTVLDLGGDSQLTGETATTNL